MIIVYWRDMVNNGFKFCLSLRVIFSTNVQNIFLSVQTYRGGSTESTAANILFLIPVAQFEGPTTTRTLKDKYYFVLVILRKIFRMIEFVYNGNLTTYK